MSDVATYLRLVKFGHSVFALPFALAAAWLASGGVPSLRVLALVVVCAVAARTAAMAFNRLVDRGIDAENPRTSGRELPAGDVSTRGAGLLVLVSSAAFVGAAFALNALCGWLSLPVLVVLFGYSYTKRFTWLTHAVLGLSLAIAPLGAWLAVTGSVSSGFQAPLLLALAVLVWVAGFDLIYACQDFEFDRAHALHSVPARFGVPRALSTSRVLHALFAVLLVGFGISAGLGGFWYGAVLVALALLVWQHGIVSPKDLSRVNLAFFTLNGWVSVLLFIGLVLDVSLRGGGA